MALNINDSELLKRLSEDTTLTEDLDQYLIISTLAEFFLQDLRENLNLDIFELEDKYKSSGFKVDEWNTFLKHPVVSTYVDNLMVQMATAKIGQQMSQGDRQAIKGMLALKQLGETDDRSRLVVMRLPLKDNRDDKNQAMMEVK